MAWKTSTLGNPIELFRSKHFEARRDVRPILFIGGVHGDEPEGVWLAQHTLEWLRQTEEAFQESKHGPSTFPHIYPWLLVPCINPDGFNSIQRTNGNGVDLNRNFPVDNWTSEAKAPRYFPGPHAGSEIETRALVELIDETNPQVIVHCHSWNPCIVYTGAPGLAYGKFFSDSSGYVLQEDIGYPTPGSLGEYGWRKKNIPVICIELPEGSRREDVWPPLKDGIRRFFTELPTENRS